jgi:hypothetical protein
VLLTIIGFLVALPVLVQTLLWSNIPRRVLEDRATRLLGARVRVEGLHIGWSGRVRVDGVSVTLPGENEPLLRLPRTNARVTPLWRLPFTQQVHSIRLERPHLLLEQADNLEWNFERVARRFTSDAAPSGPVAASGSSQALPNIEVKEGSIEVRRADGRSETLDGINASVDTRAPLLTTARLDVGDIMSVRGSCQQGRDWRHELAFEISKTPPSLRLLLEGLPEIAASGRWEGRVSNTQLVGRLELRSASAGSLRLVGKLLVSVGEAVQVDVSNVDVLDPVGDGVSTKLVGGTVHYAQGTVFVHGVQLRRGGGSAVLSGQFGTDGQTGSVSLAARDIPVGETNICGTMKGTLERGMFGGPVLQVAATTTARTRNGELEGSFRLRAEGDTLRRLSWTAEGTDALISPLTTDRIPSWTASGMSQVGDDGRTLVTLDRVTVSEAPGLRARGGLVLSASARPQEWWLWSNGERLTYTAPRVGRRPLAYDIHLDGVGGRAAIRSLHLELGDAIISGSGSFDADRQLDPLRLQLDFRQFTPVWGVIVREPRLLRGAVHADLVMVARFQPLDYRFFGRVAGHQVRLHQTRLGQFLAIVEGNGNADGLALRTRRVRLFGGDWDAEILVPRPESKPIDLRLAARRVKLTQLARALDLPIDPDGVGKLELRGTIASDRRDTRLAGVIEMAEARFLSPATDRLRVPFELADNQLRLELDATSGTGRADVSLTAGLDRLNEWTIAGTLRDWPLEPTDAETRITASATTERLVLTLSEDGPLLAGRLDAELLGSHPRYRDARVSASLLLRRQRTEVLELQGEALGAKVSGNGVLNLERLDESVLNVELTGLDADQLVAAFPGVSQLAGRFDASLRLSPPTVPRPTGPLEAELRLGSTDASFRGVPIGDGLLLAHIGHGPDGSRLSRVTLDRTELSIGGGSLRLFARLTRVPSEDELRALANLEIDGLQLDQLAPALPEQWRDIVGRLDGAIDFFGDPRNPQAIDIRGRLTVRDARLSSTPALASIFAAANAGPAPSRPTGTADVSFRLEQDRLVVPRFTVFERGTYLEGYAIELGGVSRWPQSELKGYALASARPLRDIRVPVLSSLVSSVDEVVSALQREVTAVRIGGTVAEPSARQVNLAEVYDGVRWLFGR